MKIGLSYSRCVRNIIDAEVDIDDVLVIITRTDFNPHDDTQWSGIWRGYHDFYAGNPEWANYPPEDEQKFRDISIELYDSGRMHQPRQFGAHPRRLPYVWLETVLPNSELSERPAVKAAWNKFQVLAGLGGVELNEDHKA